MKVYKLYVAKPLLIFYLLMLSAFVIVGVVGIIVGALGKLGSDGPPVWIFVFILGFGFFSACMWLRFPFEIKIRDDSMIEFRSIFRRVVVSANEIKAVRAKRYALGFVDVLHERGKVHLLNQIDGFHDFLATLKSLNPTVKIQGC
jgi:hypothetical protein